MRFRCFCDMRLQLCVLNNLLVVRGSEVDWGCVLVAVDVVVTGEIGGYCFCLVPFG